MQDKLIFLIGSPRAGTTMLSRMLGAHSAIHAPDEPHLLTPLAHLGYDASVEKAPYDPIITRLGLRALVEALPRGEEDWYAALRACTDEIYAALLRDSGARLLLDKTPAYALVLDFAARLYPEAHWVVITRHPLAVWSSFVESFFDGDHEVAHAHNPLMERYVPAIARFLRERPVPAHHVRYEELVADPEGEAARICAHLGLDYEPGMVDYGDSESGAKRAAAGLGDPMTVSREKRPTTENVSKWAASMAETPGKLEQAAEILARLADEDLETWGYSRKAIQADIDAATPPDRPRRKRLTRYNLERRVVVALRRNIHRNAFGRLVHRVREACDILLR